MKRRLLFSIGGFFPPNVSDKSLSVSSVTSSGFDVGFTKATDPESDQSELVYKLYIDIGNYPFMRTVSETEANGFLEDSGTDVSILSVSGRTEGDDITFNVIVEDPDGNKSVYDSGLQLIPDTTAPTVGTSTLSTASVQDTSFNVNFTEATDNVDGQSELTYTLYTSTSDNLTTDAATVEANGTQQDQEDNTDGKLSATGLSQATTYYYNIVVEDLAGNKSIYTSNSQLTTGTPPDSTDPSTTDSTLATSSVTGSGWDVDYTQATDDTTVQGNIVYKLYLSDTNNIDTLTNIDSNGTLHTQGTGVGSLSVTGLSELETKWFNITAEDEAGNRIAYTQNSETTADVTDPVPGDSGTLATTEVKSNSFKATYTKATDNNSAQSTLVYNLYTSTSNNVDTVTNAEANGTLQETNTDVAQLLAEGLNTDTLYYFNVVVEDEAGNKAAYTMNSQETADLSNAVYNGNFTLEAVSL